MISLRRFSRNKRGITPVLSNLLLTVVAVGIMALATSATYIITTDLRENMSERMVIEDVWFASSPTEISIYIRNVGKVSVHISGVYVNHTSQFYLPIDFEIGSHAWLNISYGWTAGDLYFLDTVTTRGTHVGGYYWAI